MSEIRLPCLDVLEATPSTLRGLMAGLDHDDLIWKPAPDRFSVGEVLAHLSQSEGDCYRTRVNRFMTETNPELESDDAQDHLELYAAANPEDSFDRFEEQREANVEFLRSLTLADGARTAMHPKVGPITLSQMLHEWALHDLGHIRQVAELVRARKYLGGAGPLASFYQLKP
jgi:hypothetical protein